MSDWADSDHGWSDDDNAGWDDDELNDNLCVECGYEHDGNCDNLEFEAFVYGYGNYVAADDELFDARKDPQTALEKLMKFMNEIQEKRSSKNVKTLKVLEATILLLLTLGSSKINEMISQYELLLTYTDTVTKNELNNSIRRILNKINELNYDGYSEQIYQLTLNYFKNKPTYERIWFEYGIQLCKIHLSKIPSKWIRKGDKQQILIHGYIKSIQINAFVPDCITMIVYHFYFINHSIECNLLLNELHNYCKNENGVDDPQKGALLLETYNIRIQLMIKTNKTIGLYEIFEKAHKLSSDINEPGSLCIIKESYGKYYALQNRWYDAYDNFLVAFRCCHDINHENIKQCLIYVVITSMLAGDCDYRINPFATYELSVYQSIPDIVPISQLYDAFQNDDIKQFEDILCDEKNTILQDDFNVYCLSAVRVRLRSNVLVKIIKPYKRIKLCRLCLELNIDMEEMERLLVSIICDGIINGHIDPINNVLEIEHNDPHDHLYNSMKQWKNVINRLRDSIITRHVTYKKMDREINTERRFLHSRCIET
eukprot:142940_1